MRSGHVLSFVRVVLVERLFSCPEAGGRRARAELTVAMIPSDDLVE
jgi:hypothetical protein